MFSRSFRRPTTLVIAILLSGVFLFHQAIDAAVKPRTSEPVPTDANRLNSLSNKGSAAKKLKRLREGTKLTDRIGTFTRTGEIEFVFKSEDEDRQFAVLLNLAIDRISTTLEQRSALSASQLQWSVSGTLTEFRGENYLLVTRAQIANNKAKAAQNNSVQ